MDRNIKCFWRFVSIVTWNNYVAVIVIGKYLKTVITMFVNLVTPVMHVFLLIVLHFTLNTILMYTIQAAIHFVSNIVQLMYFTQLIHSSHCN